MGLQTQLNSLHRAASRLEIKVNMDKSNIVGIRKVGRGGLFLFSFNFYAECFTICLMND